MLLTPLTNTLFEELKSKGFVLAAKTEAVGRELDIGVAIFIKLPVIKSRPDCWATDAPHSYRDGLSHDLHNASNTLASQLQYYTYATSPEVAQAVKEQEKALTGLFGTPIFVEQIPNQYSTSDPYCRNFPWFTVTTKIGHVTLGWRKRVIEVRWHGTTATQDPYQLLNRYNGDIAAQLLHNTYEPGYIHCWSYEEAQHVINALGVGPSSIGVPA